MSNKVSRTKLSRTFKSLSLDKEDLKKLLDILQLKAEAASAIEYQKASNNELKDLDLIKTNLEKCSKLKVTIKGSNNEELFGTINEVFNFPSFPEKVISVYVNSELIYRSDFNYFPENSFQLFIDFSKPKILDFSFQPSESTPNDSHFDVQGSDNVWVNGVFFEIDSFIKSKPSTFSNVHKGGIYDLLVWLFGIPFGFWLCYRIILLNLNIFKEHTFLENVFLTYCFFIGLFLLRIIFHYFRWVYPMLEFKNKQEKSLGHQTALLSITIGLIGSVIYDLIRLIINS